MSRIFDETLLRFKSMAGIVGGVWFPPVDVYETEGSVVLKAELPGIDIDNVAIEVTGNILTIKGERKQRDGLRDSNFYRMERAFGTFHRAFSLPKAVDRSAIKAYLKDGILRITAPKGFETGHRAQGSSRVKVE